MPLEIITYLIEVMYTTPLYYTSVVKCNATEVTTNTGQNNHLFLQCTAFVSLLFGTVIPTSFNILMEMFLLPFIHGLRLFLFILQVVMKVMKVVIKKTCIWF